MAVRRRLGQVSNTLLDYYLKKRAVEHQSGLVGQRQRELAEQNQQAQLLKDAFGDPTGAIFDSLRRSGITRLGKMPLSSFFPTPKSAVGRMGKEIAGVSDPAKLFTDEDISARFAQEPGSTNIDPLDPPPALAAERPPIEELIAQRNARRTALEAEQKRIVAAKPVEVEEYDVEGRAPMKRFLTQGEVAGRSFQQKPTPAQEASNFNLMEGLKETQMGATAETVSKGQARGQWLDPDVQANREKLERVRAEAGVSAAVTQAGMIENVKHVNAIQNTMLTLSPQIEQVIALSLEVNQALGADWVGRAKEAIGGALQLDPRAAELNRRIQNLSTLLANDPLIGGNRGATSENDRAAVAGRFARAGTGKELTEALATFKNDLAKAYDTISRLPLQADALARKNAVRSALGLSQLGSDNEAVPDGQTPIGNQILGR